MATRAACFWSESPAFGPNYWPRSPFEGLWIGIDELAPGKRLGDVGAAIQRHSSRKTAVSVVREYCGHGIGRAIPRRPAGTALRHSEWHRPGTAAEGMTLTVEPMVNAGKRQR